MTRRACRIAATILWLAANGSAPAQNSFTVTATTDANPFGLGVGSGSSGDLRYCIHQANALSLTGQLVTINFGLPANSTITLGQNILPPLNPGRNGQLGANPNSLLIDGSTASGLTIDGGNSGFGIFMAYSGAITIQNLTLANGLARGGAGGAGGGGGGMGAGGGILVNNLASMTAASVTFNNTHAQGGAGGSGYGLGGGGGTNGGNGGNATSAYAGGGGLGGNGGNGNASVNTGGGGGVGGAGGSGTGATGAGGQFTNGVNGVSGGGPNGGGGSAGAGGLFALGGGGGVTAGASGAGGFGGGGGGGGGSPGGTGGEYGGGGSGTFGAAGGFGGGGGGGGAGLGVGGFGGGGSGDSSHLNSGGYGAGQGNPSGGGGGLGAGGAAFVRAGGTLTLIDPTFTGLISASGGAAGGSGAGAGQGLGQGLFLGGSVTIQVSQGNTLTQPFADFLGGGSQAQGGIIKSGPGTLILNAANGSLGPTAINGGTLQLGASGALPSPLGVSLANNAGATLDINGYTQAIGTLSGGGTAGGSVLLGNGTLTIGGSTGVFGGTITGGGSVTKVGSGSQTFTGTGSSIGSLVCTAGGLTLSGGSLSLTASGSPLTVGGTTTGATLTVSNGGVVTTTGAANAVLVDGAAGTSTVVTGTGSRLSTGSNLTVGNTGNGGLTVQSGGTVSVAGNMQLAANFGGSGTATVTGAGSAFTVAGQINFGSVSGAGPASLTVASGGNVTAGGVLLRTSPASITVNRGTLSAGLLSDFGGGTPSIFLSDPAGGIAFTFGAANTTQAYSGSIADAAAGPGTVSKVGTATETLTGHLTNTGGYAVGGGTLEFSGAVVQPGPGALTAMAGATIQYDSNASVFGGFLRGPGTHVVTGGATLSGVTSLSGAAISQTGPSTLRNFTNGGPLTVAAGLAAPVVFDGFTNQGSGAITVGASSQVNAADFETYGTVTFNPGSTVLPTQMTNTGASPIYFNGGSRTFISVPTNAGNFDAGIDLHGQNAVVAGGLFVNNGYVVDSMGTHAIIADFGSVVKGAGFYQTSPQTVNGGKFQSGNSPGKATFGSFTFGPGGVSNYVFAIDDATGTAGPSPDAKGHVSGWGLVRTVQRPVGAATTQGDFAWTADPANPLTVHLDTLVNPTTVGTDISGPMADFDPMKPYTWLAASWAGSYSGPTDPAALNASTAFDTTGFANSIAGTFGWSLDAGAHSLSLTYTPNAVPEPGTLILTGLVGLSVATWHRRPRRVIGSPKRDSGSTRP